MKFSLRALITIPLIAQIVGVTAVTGWLAHRNGQEAVEELAYQLLNQTGEHLQHKLDTYTSIPQLITQENKDALELQQLDPENLDRWLPHLFRQMQRFPDVTYIYYGNADGRYVELSRLPDGSLELALNNDASDQSVKISQVTRDGRLQSTTPKNSYDPRQRPWYQLATNNQSPRWTGIYDFEDPSPTLGISFVSPYLGTDNSFQGVLGADFTLDAIKAFVRRVQTSPSSAMFLMDVHGKILASSTGQTSFNQQTPSASDAADEQQFLVEAAADHVLNRLTNEPLQSAQQFRFRIRGENYWVQITPFADEYGLSWLGVSLLPEADFTGQIRANSRNTVLLSLLAMTVSGGVSILIARWINRPIEHLGLATQTLVKGDTSQALVPSSIQEINLLIDSFNRMADDLKTSRSQLKVYSHQLEELVERRTQALQRSEETFAKVFQASPNSITLSTLEEGRYIKVNDRFTALLGLSREKILGHTSTELGIWMEPKTRDVFRQELINNRLRNQEWAFRNALGAIKTVLLSAEIIYFQEEACVLVIANDISDRIAKQEQLRQSEERWQLALRGNNDGIWDWSIAAGEIFYSARWKEILGYRDDEIGNHKSEWERRLHPDDRERVLRSTQAHLAQQTSFFTEEYRLRCKNGEYKWILDRGQALWDETGTPIRMVGSHTDIS